MPASTVGTSTGSGTVANGSSFSAALPSGVVQNDLLICIAGMNGISTPTWTPPSGWTQQHQNFTNSAPLVIFTKVAGISESGPYSFSQSSGSAVDGGWGIIALRGIDPATPFLASSSDGDISSGGGSVSSTTVPAASWAGAVDAISVIATTTQPSSATITWPSGWNQSPDGFTANDGYEWCTVAVNVTTNSAVTSLPSQTLNFSPATFGNDNQYALQVALEPGGVLHWDPPSLFFSPRARRFHSWVPTIQLNAAWDDVTARFQLVAAAWADVTARFRLAAQAWDDVQGRFRLLGQSWKDAGGRFRLNGLGARDVQSRYRLVVGVVRDAASRFRLTVGAWKDVQSRFRLFGRGIRDVPSRFRLLVGTVATRDVQARLRVIGQSVRDIPSRFRLTVRVWRDVSARFALAVAAARDVPGRFRLTVRSLRDVQSRFRLRAAAWRDLQSRFRLAAATARDLPGRFRLAVSAATDVGARFALQFAVGPATGLRDYVDDREPAGSLSSGKPWLPA